jgi:uncharacterized protein YndB with AHSA1/START domain
VAEFDAKSMFRVVRTIDVTAAPDAVFAQLDDFHRWTAWSPWEDRDPNLERTYKGSDSGVDAIYEWKGNRKAGEGRMEILAAEPPSGLTIKLEFLKPFKSEGTVTFALEADGDTTHVTWSMIGPKTMMTRVMGLFMSMDKAIGPDFEKGLTQLKALVEA